MSAIVMQICLFHLGALLCRFFVMSFLKHSTRTWRHLVEPFCIPYSSCPLFPHIRIMAFVCNYFAFQIQCVISIVLLSMEQDRRLSIACGFEPLQMHPPSNISFILSFILIHWIPWRCSFGMAHIYWDLSSTASTFAEGSSPRRFDVSMDRLFILTDY